MSLLQSEAQGAVFRTCDITTMAAKSSRTEPLRSIGRSAVAHERKELKPDTKRKTGKKDSADHADFCLAPDEHST